MLLTPHYLGPYGSGRCSWKIPLLSAHALTDRSVPDKKDGKLLMTGSIEHD